jgi:Chain length determinant protein
MGSSAGAINMAKTAKIPEPHGSGGQTVNDPDQTISLPVVELSGEPNGTSPRRPSPLEDTIIRPADMSSPRAPVGANAERSRLEPTRFGAARRYGVIVLAVAILGMVAAVGYSLMQPKVYRAQALIAVPQRAFLLGQQADSGQDIDSQVLLLQSQDVAQRAATIGNATLHSNSLAAGDFLGTRSSLRISPPTTASPGGYGARIITVSFTASTPATAQAGTNAVVQAYDEARSASIKSQYDTAMAGIDAAINSTNSQLAAISAAGSGASATAQSLEQLLLAQRTTLFDQRVNEQIDLAQQPTVVTEPAAMANHKWALAGGIGLVIGLLVGVALAFVWASRRRPTAADRDGSEASLRPSWLRPDEFGPVMRS